MGLHIVKVIRVTWRHSGAAVRSYDMCRRERKLWHLGRAPTAPCASPMPGGHATENPTESGWGRRGAEGTEGSAAQSTCSHFAP